MAEYFSKDQVKADLKEARNNLRITRKNGEKEKAAFWLKKCNDLQAVLDAWSK